MSYLEEIKVKNIDHLGIVAGLIDEIGIVKIINNKLGIDVREKISAGTVVKSILINGLGFVSRPLYLFSQFFEDKEENIIKERPIFIKKGYSRDHRPDLKQCVLDLITTQDGDLPLFVRVGDGNEADKAVFGKILVEFKKQIKFDSIMVCDSALYSQENLTIIQHLKWITRVPMTLKKAKELVQNVEIEEITDDERKKRSLLHLEGYAWKEEIVTYGGIKQTWLIVSSEKRQKSDWEKLEKKLKQESEK